MSTDELYVVRQQIPTIRIRTSSSKRSDFLLAVQRLMRVVYSVLDSLPTFKPSLLMLVVNRRLHSRVITEIKIVTPTTVAEKKAYRRENYRNAHIQLPPKP
jgi:hypothetical protein